MASQSALLSAVCLLVAVTGAAAAAVGKDLYARSGDDWPELCRKGKRQSPINIVSSQTVFKGKSPSFKFDYALSNNVTIVNTGYGIEMRPEAGTTNKLYLKDGPYTMLQFHFHEFSEHTINGHLGALELHYVHVSDNDPNKLAVVGVYFRFDSFDRPNKFLAKFTDMIPSTKSSKVIPVSMVPSELFLPINGRANLDYYNYPGSLTTPGCAEIVEWHVLRKAQFASVNQVKTFLNAVAAASQSDRTDNRLPQPLNGRTVSTYSASQCSCSEE